MNDITYNTFYSSAINDISLTKALDIHYEKNPNFRKWNEYKSELMQKTMKAHDIAHVVFGCDTTLSGEFRVELFSFFGVNLTFEEYRKWLQIAKLTKNPLRL